MQEKTPVIKKRKIAERTVIFLIKTYKKTVSPYIGRTCRFVPSCSEYAEEALEKYGFTRGLTKAFWRILRCNPFSPGGYDPVERKEQSKEEK